MILVAFRLEVVVEPSLQQVKVLVQFSSLEGVVVRLEQITVQIQGGMVS
jgi:hypothetical protein